jgi:tripartite-type tricarboxylate transporter receptor subunit TctC
VTTIFKHVLMAAGVALASLTAAAFPTKPVSILVPYAPGGSTDVIARVLAEHMARDLGQAVVVENLGGAGGTIGTAKVVRAPNDGHTVLFHNTGLVIAPSLYNKLNFDVSKDLEPIAHAGDVPMILVRNSKFAPATVGELIKHMKAKPGEVKFAHAGVGATSYLCAVLFNQATATTTTMVPYRGTGPALMDVLAGNVDMICDQPVSTSAYLQAGTLKAYAVATQERLPILPSVPTFTESGLPGFQLAVWHGFYAPKGTPQPVIDRLNKAVRAAFANPVVVKRLAELGVVLPQGDRLKPEALREFTASELKAWPPVLAAAGASID